MVTAEGTGLTVIAVVADAVKPLPSVSVTVYTYVTVTELVIESVTDEPEVADRPVDGDQEYDSVGVPLPVAVKVVDVPLHTFAEVGETETVGTLPEIPVKSAFEADIPVADNVWVLVLVAPYFIQGNTPVYSPMDMLASVPTTSPVA